MKSKLLSLAAVLCVSVTLGNAQIHIREIGLSGYVALNRPGRVRVEVTNPTGLAGTFTLNFRSFETYQDSPIDYERQTNVIHLDSGETQTLDLPFFFTGQGKLHVDVVDFSGTVVGSDERAISKPTGSLIAIVCKSSDSCTQVAQGLRSAGTIQERNQREQNLSIILLQEPPEVWYAYTPATRIVVATQISNHAAQQALADCIRLGGKVTVIGDKDPGFLAEYRVSGARENAVGEGKLMLADHTDPVSMEDLASSAQADFGTYFTVTNSFEAAWLLDWTGTHFTFPGISGVLLWSGVYILIVGLLNFWVLRRLNRMELGWFTVPALALLFALGFYVMGARNKLKTFALDEVTVCTMDDVSSRGAVDTQFRVAAPRLSEISLRVPNSTVMSSVNLNSMFRASDLADIWSQRRPRQAEQVPEIRMDSAQHLDLQLLRLSYRDFGYETVRQFPGTVHIENGEIVNGTGQRFSDSVLADFSQHRFWKLGAFDATAKLKAFAGPVENLPPTVGYVRPPDGEFSLTELMRHWRFNPDGFKDNLVFIGVTDAPMLNGTLEGINPRHRSRTIFIVRLRNNQ